ncbi:MAG: agmatine deiminase family protein [Prevotella sp.]|jgi:agmatine/peptidylarginine deiminase
MSLRSNDRDYVLPAEWERQSGIQLTWPHAGTDWKPYLEQITETFLELTGAIAQREKLIIVTPDIDGVKTQIGSKWGKEIFGNINFYECETNDTWTRDHGAITLVSQHEGQQNTAQSLLLNFKFNGWGEKFDWQKDNAINMQLYDAGAFNGVLENYLDFVLEGGSIESDGQGTIMTTTSCLLAPHRNQPLNRQQIEQRMLDFFRADRVIWIEHGHLVGDDTDGHIDTLVRMAPADTLLYVGCDDEQDEQYEELKAMEQQLKTLKTVEGKPYQLLKLPMPQAIYDHGERLPATYANFVILNGAVIVPTYNQVETDDEAMKIVGQAFPDREIIGIDATTVIRQHGSHHCLTMQFPYNIL